MNNPVELSDKLLEMADEFSDLSEKLSVILRVKPAVWMKLRVEQKSDSSTDKVWEATPDGVEETQIKIRLRAIEKLMSAIRTRLRITEVEARNIV